MFSNFFVFHSKNMFINYTHLLISMIKRLLIYLGLILVLISGAMAESLRIEGISTTPPVITSGEEATLTFKLENYVSDSSDPKYSYVVSLEPRGELSKEYVEVLDGERRLGNMGSMESRNALFDVKFNEGAPSASYKFDLVIERYLGDTLISTHSISESVVVSGDSYFEIGMEPDQSLDQGSQKSVDFYIENVGGSSASDIELIFENTQELGIVGSNSVYIGGLDNGEKIDFQLDMYAKDNIDSDTYSMPVELNYQDDSDIKSRNYQLGIPVFGDIDLRIGNIETSPKEVRPGHNSVLIEAQVQNNGDGDAESVKVKLEDSELKPSYSNSNVVELGDIDGGTSNTAKFYVDVDRELDSGERILDVVTEYRTFSDEKHQETLNFPIYIQEKPILEIESIDNEMLAGSSEDITVEVKNIGDQLGEEVDVRLVLDSSLPFSVNERSQYLGAIDSGESRVTTFNIDSDRNADLGEYNVQAFLRVRGDSETGNNEVYTFNRNVDLEVTGTSPNYLMIAGILVGILVIFSIAISTLFRKGNKSKKKSSQE